ncbi:MAG: hypothetical protein LC637_05170, partial [Xanthomonadaceae bacterium]|nr:hypothetical protein [Xanthomonadaceae bacterium]
AQFGMLNSLTDLGTPFPPGCLSIEIPELPQDGDAVLVNQNINVASINSSSRNATVRVLIWRVACADEGFSTVLVRLQQVGGSNAVVVPRLYAEAGIVDVPGHQAQLLLNPGSGNVGATGDFVTTGGTTWMLAVDPLSIDSTTTFLPDDYNEIFTLELNWGAFATAQPEGFRFELDRFEPSVDGPQFDNPVLNGRFSGQWVSPDRNFQGLVLQIGEQVEDNFVFAIFFTFLDGQPFWLVANSEPAPMEPGPITLDMLVLDQGGFITDASQPARDDVNLEPAGQITIRVIDCGNLAVDYDLTPIGKGSGTLPFERLIRIAGYDCNPWQ